MHITNQNVSFYIFTVRNLQNPYNVFLAIATNTPVLLMNAFVLQGHI